MLYYKDQILTFEYNNFRNYNFLFTTQTTNSHQKYLRFLPFGEKVINVMIYSPSPVMTWINAVSN